MYSMYSMHIFLKLNEIIFFVITKGRLGNWVLLSCRAFNFYKTPTTLEFQFRVNHTSHIQLFQEKLSEKVHTTIPKGIVGIFEFTVLQWNLKEWHERPWTYLSYSARNSVLIISHITFPDCRLHFFSNNLFQSSSIH